MFYLEVWGRVVAGRRVEVGSDGPLPTTQHDGGESASDADRSHRHQDRDGHDVAVDDTGHYR